MEYRQLESMYETESDASGHLWALYAIYVEGVRFGREEGKRIATMEIERRRRAHEEMGRQDMPAILKQAMELGKGLNK